MPNLEAPQMEARAATLEQLLAVDLPPLFVRELLDTAPNLYYGTAEADYLLGHVRRALFETKVRNLGVEHGLTVTMESPEKGGCQHVRLSVGRFTFTVCHVAAYDGFPVHSESREQYSEINQHLAQGQLFPVESQPKSEQIYGVIVHAGIRDDFRGISIGFPNNKFTDWVQRPTDLRNIADMQMYQPQQDTRKQIQSTEPKWKSTAEGAAANQGDKK
jgi:hypothetical protein